MYRPVKQTYFVMYWFQNIYYCYLVYYFCLKVIKSYPQTIIIKRHHIRNILYIFWISYTIIMVYNFINDYLNPSILCKCNLFISTLTLNQYLNILFKSHPLNINISIIIFLNPLFCILIFGNHSTYYYRSKNKETIFGYTRGINFIMTLGFIILVNNGKSELINQFEQKGKLLQKRVDNIINISGIEDESMYNKQMNNVWSLIKWSVCGQFFYLIGTFYLILNDFTCEFVPYEGYEDRQLRVYMNFLVVMLYRISSYFIFIIAPLRAFWVKDYADYYKKFQSRENSEFAQDIHNTFFFRGLGHKRTEFNASMTSNLEDPLTRRDSPQDQCYAKKSGSFSNNQGYSTPYLNKTEDFINTSQDLSSNRHSRIGNQATNLEITESRTLMF